MMTNCKEKHIVALVFSIVVVLAVGMPAIAYADLSAAEQGDSSIKKLEMQATSNAKAKASALNALENRLDGMRNQLYVYRDYSDSMNHFTQKSKMWGLYESCMKDMDENCTKNPYSGTSCLKCTQTTNRVDWGGWEFYNGRGSGVDLTGATELRFWARGKSGGEVIDFFVAGGSGDKASTITSYNVTLTSAWKEYSISLKGANLSSVHRGFGYSIDYTENPRDTTVFYLDDIRFVGKIQSLQEAPMLLRSYDTDNLQTHNAAYTYDNALTAMAFMSAGKNNKAAEILDAFVYAIEHDRYESGRIRNAYAAGDISPQPGWSAGASLPGWWDADAQEWYEDQYQVGSNVGNTSYAALALLQFASANPSSYRSNHYVEAAESIMNWVIKECSDDSSGFTAGYDGWPENGTVTRFTYKSTEHNIDAYAAFSRLYDMTGNTRYQKAAASALAFVESMYDADKHLFYTGTNSDGSTSTENIVLDAQVWSALALGDAFKPYASALDQLDALRTSEGGYRFHVCKQKAYWCEGTAFTALMHKLRGEKTKASNALNAVKAVQLKSGMVPAATSKKLTTGIYLSDGQPWLYGTDPAVAPTAWLVMATNGYNPYTFEASGSGKVAGKKKLTINKRTVGASDIAKMDRKTVTKITLGKKVRKISAKSFAKCPKLETLVVKSTKLTAKSVKNSLKGSNVKTVKAPTKALAKKYKAIFTKANCGKKVKVTA